MRHLRSQSRFEAIPEIPFDDLVVLDQPAVLVEPDVCRTECDPPFNETTRRCAAEFLPTRSIGELYWGPRKQNSAHFWRLWG